MKKANPFTYDTLIHSLLTRQRLTGFHPTARVANVTFLVRLFGGWFEGSLSSIGADALLDGGQDCRCKGRDQGSF